MKQCKVIALMLLALALLAGCSSPDPIDLEEPVEQVPTAAELQASLEDGGSTREVTLYYKDLMGYLVPVNCEIPWEEGIAKATLKQMVSSEENDLQAARLGLLTALPEGPVKGEGCAPIRPARGAGGGHGHHRPAGQGLAVLGVHGLRGRGGGERHGQRHRQRADGV